MNTLSKHQSSGERATPSSPLSQYSNTMFSSSVSPPEMVSGETVANDRSRPNSVAAKLFKGNKDESKKLTKKKSKSSHHSSKSDKKKGKVVRQRMRATESSDNSDSDTSSDHRKSKKKKSKKLRAHNDSQSETDSSAESEGRREHSSEYSSSNDSTDTESNNESDESSSEEEKEVEIRLPDRKRPLPVSAIHNIDRSGRTVLFKYASRGDHDTCLLLLKHGAQINISDYAGWSPLHESCLEGHTKVVSLLLSYGAHVDCPGGDGDTPLHDAIGNGHVEVVKVLLSYGASLTAKNDQNHTPLEAAKERLSEFDEILWNPQKANEKKLKKRKSSLSSRQETVSSSATKRHNPILSDTSSDDNDQNSDALDEEEEYDEEEKEAAIEAKKIVDVLQEWQDMTEMVSRRNPMGQSCLHEAAIQGRHDLVRKYLEYGADVQSADSAGWTPLHEAALKGHIRVVKTLLEFGAHVSPRGLEDDTPLHDAASNGHLEIVKLLLEYGANPHTQNTHGKTAVDVISHSDPSSSQIAELLNRSLDSWTPYKQPLYIPRLLKPYSTKDAEYAFGDGNSVPPLPTVMVGRSSSVGLTVSTTGNNGIGSNFGKSQSVGGLDTISPQTAPYPFAWGGLDPQRGPFASAREEKKFKALLKSIEKVESNDGGVGNGQTGSGSRKTGSKPSISRSIDANKRGRDRQNKKNEKRKQLRLAEDDVGSAQKNSSSDDNLDDDARKSRFKKKLQEKLDKKKLLKQKKKRDSEERRHRERPKRVPTPSDEDDNTHDEQQSNHDASQEIIDSFSSSEDEISFTKNRKGHRKSTTNNNNLQSDEKILKEGSRKKDGNGHRGRLAQSTPQSSDSLAKSNRIRESSVASSRSNISETKSSMRQHDRTKDKSREMPTTSRAISESADESSSRPLKKHKSSRHGDELSSMREIDAEPIADAKELNGHKRSSSAVFSASSEVEGSSVSQSQSSEVTKKKKKKRMVLSGYQSAAVTDSTNALDSTYGTVSLVEPDNEADRQPDTQHQDELIPMDTSENISLPQKQEKYDALPIGDESLVSDEPHKIQEHNFISLSGANQEPVDVHTPHEETKVFLRSPDPASIQPPKKKKKSWLGISGYQKAGGSAETCADERGKEENNEIISQTDTKDVLMDIAPITNMQDTSSQAITPASVTVEPSIGLKDKVNGKLAINWDRLRKHYGLPLYVFYTSQSSSSEGEDSFVVDLQLALALGFKTGRELLSEYPDLLPASESQPGIIQGRAASQSEKDTIQSSPVGFGLCHALLERMIHVKGESCRRWLKLVPAPQGYDPSNPLNPIDSNSYAITRTDASLQGLKLAGVDLQLISFDRVVQLLHKSDGPETPLSMGYGKHKLDIMSSDVPDDVVFIHVSIDSSNPENHNAIQVLSYQPPLPNLAHVDPIYPVSMTSSETAPSIVAEIPVISDTNTSILPNKNPSSSSLQSAALHSSTSPLTPPLTLPVMTQIVASSAITKPHRVPNKPGHVFSTSSVITETPVTGGANQNVDKSNSVSAPSSTDTFSKPIRYIHKLKRAFQG